MNWIDAIILIVVAISAIRGYLLGLSGSILYSLSVIMAWVTAFVLAAPVKNLLQALFGIVSSLAHVFEPLIPSTALAPNTPVVDAIQNSQIPEWLANFFERIADKGYTVSTVGQLWSYWIANVLLLILIFLILLFLFSFLYRFLVERIRFSLPKEGFVHDFDHTLGAILHGLITLFVCIGVLVLFTSLFPIDAQSASDTGVAAYVNSSFFGGLVYQNFLGIQTIFGSIVRFVAGW